MKIKTIDDWKKIIAKIFQKLKEKNTNLVLLSGPLGAGKTSLSQKIGLELGIKEKINSPTFVILKKYEIIKNDNFKNLIHIDAYRLNSKKDLELIDFFEYLEDKKNLILLEWPEKIELDSKIDFLKIKIDYDGDGRVVEIF